MSNATRANRPAPHLISFAPECFEVIGTETTYSVSRSALHSGPAEFGTNKAAAEQYAKRTGRQVSESTRQVLRRVRWF